ncbi:uncharacterized protein [Aegilops tauschii subsp. strangulata]|uniref:uncharacterized protein n=1 Tax=Aegilops tauschii subsp. strangulata TaxID=200361 RepID=UPI003CC85CE9
MAKPNVKLMCWNVRGLNAPAHRDTVRDLIRDYNATIVCLQETKLDHVDDTLIESILGPSFTASYHVLPVVGSRGGMIMAVSDAYFRLSDFQATLGSISATVTMLVDCVDWTLSCVYGPQGEQDKLLFINKLRGLKYLVKPRWLILGDFNLITKAADKNNLNINNRLIGSFRSALNHLQLKEMRLSGCKFTWSNAQENPVLT